MMKRFSIFKAKKRGKSSPELREQNASRKPPTRLVKSTGSISSPRSIPELYKEKGHNLTKFSFSELRNATDNFNRLLKIGEGGFGSVYKGSLRPLHSQAPPLVVAIKKLNRNGMQKITFVNANQPETYIVSLIPPHGIHFAKPEDRLSWYNSFLTASSDGSNEKPSIIHAYHYAFTGFAAKLSADQVKAMENMDGFVSARPERVYKLLQTTHTHTPRFLGLHQNLGFWRGSNYGKGIIIGILDTGITPGHPSFDDTGVPAPPSKWKGKCEVVGCNNKEILLILLLVHHSWDPYL